MLKQLLLRQWKKALGLLLFLCVVTVLGARSSFENRGRFYEYQTVYMESFDLWQRDAFFARLEKDNDEASALTLMIQNYEGYTGTRPDGSDDPLLSMFGTYTDYNMLLWQAQMLQAPGKYSPTVEDDALMLHQLDSRLSSLKNVQKTIQNQIEVMNRNIRRGGKLVPVYEECLRQLQNIDTETFPVEDTLHIDLLLHYLKLDWRIQIVLALIFFSVFSTNAQEKISNYILTTKTGMRRYAFAQFLAALILSVGAMVVYYGIALLAYSGGNFENIPWTLPIQAVTGHNTVLLDLRVWEYLLLLIGSKILFCCVTVSAVLLVSLLSKNNVISAMASLLLCGIPILMRTLFASSGNPYTGMWFGHTDILFKDLCFWDVSGWLIPYTTVYIAGAVTVVILLGALVVLLSKSVAKGWVK